ESAAGSNTALLVADSHLFYQAPIFGELIARHRAQFLRRTAPYGKAQLLELAADIRIAECLHDLGIEPGNDGLWRSGWRKHRKPGIEQETGQSRFINGGHLGKRRQSLRRTDADQPKLVAPHQSSDRPQALEADRNLTGSDVGRRLRRTLVRHVGQRDPGA